MNNNDNKNNNTAKLHYTTNLGFNRMLKLAVWWECGITKDEDHHHIRLYDYMISEWKYAVHSNSNSVQDPFFRLQSTLFRMPDIDMLGISFKL